MEQLFVKLGEHSSPLLKANNRLLYGRSLSGSWGEPPGSKYPSRGGSVGGSGSRWGDCPGQGGALGCPPVPTYRPSSARSGSGAGCKDGGAVQKESWCRPPPSTDRHRVPQPDGSSWREPPYRG